jgi:ABC-type proline/glycine betaine transport system permease subunit
MQTFALMIGAGGLGNQVFQGIQRLQTSSGLGIVLLAIASPF